jgi:hypothetical protein
MRVETVGLAGKSEAALLHHRALCDRLINILRYLTRAHCMTAREVAPESAVGQRVAD